MIYGQNPFVSQGYNQVMSDAGAKAELVNARGVRFDYVGHGGVEGSPDQTADVGCVIE